MCEADQQELKGLAGAAKLRSDLGGHGAMGDTAKAKLVHQSMGFLGVDLSRIGVMSILPPIMHMWIRVVSTLWLTITKKLAREGKLQPAIAAMTAPRVRKKCPVTGQFVETGGPGLRCKEEVKSGSTSHTAFMGGDVEIVTKHWHLLIQEFSNPDLRRGLTLMLDWVNLVAPEYCSPRHPHHPPHRILCFLIVYPYCTFSHRTRHSMTWRATFTRPSLQLGAVVDAVERHHGDGLGRGRHRVPVGAVHDRVHPQMRHTEHPRHAVPRIPVRNPGVMN
jgi:hypothetical protein